MDDPNLAAAQQQPEPPIAAVDDAKLDAAAQIEALFDKGDGRLVKTNGVWSYPGAPVDRSGTNLVLPVEHIGDNVVQAALADGLLRVLVTDASGMPRTVILASEETAHIRAISTTAAGTPEAGTELPPGSRPTHDAGMKRPDSAAPAGAPLPPIERMTRPQLDAAAKGLAAQELAKQSDEQLREALIAKREADKRDDVARAAASNKGKAKA